MQHRYLGCRVVHPQHGSGLIVFEENVPIIKERQLQITFGDGALTTVNADRLEEFHYRLTGERLELSARYTRVQGHQGERGRATGSTRYSGLWSGSRGWRHEPRRQNQQLRRRRHALPAYR